MTKILLQPVLTRLNKTDAKIQTLTDQVSSLEDQVTDLKNEITSLKNSQDELEQYGRRNSLRIWMSDPENQGENTDELVLKYAEKVSVTVQQVKSVDHTALVVTRRRKPETPPRSSPDLL